MLSKSKIHMPSDEEDKMFQIGIDADPDAFEVTTEMMSSPEFTVNDKRRGRGKQKAATNEQKTVRLKPAVIEYLRADEKGWQKRLDKALGLVMKEHPEGIS